MTLIARTLGDVVSGRDLLTIDATASVLDAVRLMTRNLRGAILVTRSGRLAGIFTERDVMNRVVAQALDPAATPVSRVMTERLVVARPDESYHSGLTRMHLAHCRHLPVVDGDRVSGLVSRRELMALDAEVLEQMQERLEPSTLFI